MRICERLSYANTENPGFEIATFPIVFLKKPRCAMKMDTLGKQRVKYASIKIYHNMNTKYYSVFSHRPKPNIMSLAK